METFLLGSSQQPIYAKQNADGVYDITGLPDPSKSDRATFQAALTARAALAATHAERE